MKKWIRLMASFFAMLICVIFASIYVYYWDHTPEIIRIEAGTTQEFKLSVPANGTIIEQEEKKAVADVFFMQPITMIAGNEKSSYEVSLKLYGIVPFKKMEIEIIDDIQIWPVGKVYGFYLETDGVLVIGTGTFENELGERVEPALGKIKTGDYLQRINGQLIENKKQFQKIIRESEGEELYVEGLREGVYFSTKLAAQRYENGEYKLGIWIRDNAQGVGTVTYVDNVGNFGALGHPITDLDTSQILDIKDGTLYDTQIVSIQKGKHNEVGEVHGLIDYQKKHVKGSIRMNGVDGIYGMSNFLIRESEDEQSVSVAMRQEIHRGSAQILSDISGKLECYDIQITDFDVEDHSNQAISIMVTDPRLLELTGGIIQGMSGCPILQDGKFAGAVTHVLISDAQKGYGIFLEDMLINE